MDKVHEPDAGPCIIIRLRLWRQQRLDNCVDNGAEVGVGLAGKALEQVLGLRDVVLAVLFEQCRRQTLQQLFVLLLPVGVVTGLTCGKRNSLLPWQQRRTYSN